MDYNIYPKIQYGPNYVINNTIRIAIRRYVQENINYFFNYSLTDGERPEDISYDYYGDSKLHWVLLLSNEVLDPMHDWLMGRREFLGYLSNKYLPRNLNPNDYHSFVDDQGNEIPDPGNEALRARFGITNLDFELNRVLFYRDNGKRIPQPSNTERQLETKVTVFQYEEELNESHREIIIPLPEFIEEVENHLRELI